MRKNFKSLAQSKINYLRKSQTRKNFMKLNLNIKNIKMIIPKKLIY